MPVILLTMYTRTLPLPERSFFLFGPRATGKSTWLRQQLPDALRFDFLRLNTVLELTREPDFFRARVLAMPPGSWVVLDEVQRMPALLNEVHALITDRGDDYRFALCGSSARKLRRMDANLLAGRVIRREFFPLTGAELNYKFELDDLLRFGTLPAVRTAPADSVDILDAYVSTYLREEIREEALTRDIATFTRFLTVAALASGQVVNVSSIARDSGVARPTVARYFEVLVDTLIGYWLPAWRPRARIKERHHPKFYLFDPGVVRGLLGKLRDPLGDAERGPLLEGLVLHELRAARNVRNAGGEFTYWRSAFGSEVDFVWSRGSHNVGFEVKASSRWRREYGTTLNQLLEEGTLSAGYLVYTGREVLQDRGVIVLPVKEFMRRAAEGEFFA